MSGTPQPALRITARITFLEANAAVSGSLMLSGCHSDSTSGNLLYGTYVWDAGL